MQVRCAGGGACPTPTQGGWSFLCVHLGLRPLWGWPRSGGGEPRWAEACASLVSWWLEPPVQALPVWGLHWVQPFRAAVLPALAYAGSPHPLPSGTILLPCLGSARLGLARTASSSLTSRDLGSGHSLLPHGELPLVLWDVAHTGGVPTPSTSMLRGAAWVLCPFPTQRCAGTSRDRLPHPSSCHRYSTGSVSSV